MGVANSSECHRVICNTNTYCGATKRSHSEPVIPATMLLFHNLQLVPVGDASIPH